MRSFILLLCLIPTIICAQNLSLEDQLKQAIKGKKAEIGIAVIIDGKDTVTVNNDIHYPLMSVFKFHQALALADYMGKQQQSLNFELTIKKEDLKPDTYSPLRDSFPQGGFNIDIADLLNYTLQQSDNNACDILFQYQGGVDTVNQYIHSPGRYGLCHCLYGKRYAPRRKSVLSKLDYSAGRRETLGDIPQRSTVPAGIQRLHLSDHDRMPDRTRSTGCSIARQRSYNRPQDRDG